MKRIIALLIITVLCFCALTSCEVVDTVKNWFGAGEQTQSGDLDRAATSLHNICKEMNTKPTTDFDVVGQIIVDGVKYPITWTSNNESVVIKASTKSGFYTVDLPDANPTEVQYVLTATISDGNGNSIEKEYTFTLPVYDNTAVVSDLKEGQAYSLGIYQASLQKNYYIIGQMSGYYMATTEDINDSVNVYVELVDGGYQMYCVYWGTRLYINMVISDTGYVNPSFDAEAKCVYTYDDALKTLVCDINNGLYAFGVKTEPKDENSYYTTLGPVLVSNASDNYIVTFAESTVPDQADHGLHTPEAIINAAYALAQDKSLPGTHTLTGTIKSIDDAYSSQYKNITVTIVVEGFESKPIKCYRMKGTNADQLGVGDEITVTGIIKNYGGTIEFDAGCTFTNWVDNEEPSGGEGSNPSAATPVDPVVGTAYNFGMVQEKVSTSDVYYLIGGMSGYYMATGTDVSAAINVYLEETEGGYYLYTLDGESKLYINMVVSGTHVNGAYEATASTVYTYDTTYKTLIASVTPEGGEAADYWFGTRSDNTYTTVGPCAVANAGFYCQFYGAVEDGEDVGGGEGDGDSGTTTPTTVTTIPDALAAADGTKVNLTGTVHSFYEDWSSYGNCSPYIVDEAGNKILVFRTTTHVYVGDVVTVEGTITIYNTVAQVAQSGSVVTVTTPHTCTFSDATCTEASACTACGAAGTDAALGHTAANADGKCDKCGLDLSVSYVEKELSFSSTDNRTSFSTSQQVWAANGVTLTNDKGSSTSNVADYAGPARFYKSSKLTVEYANMVKIEFVCNSSSYATALQSSISTNANYTVTVDGSSVIVTFAEAVNSFVIDTLSGGQVRMNSLTVTAIG